MINYCDLCEKEKKVTIQSDRLRVCTDCADVYPDYKDTEPKRGEGDGYIVDLEKTGIFGADRAITVPDELIKKMGWKGGDTIDVGITDNCFDWGEVPSITLRNLTKEKHNNEEK